MVRPHVLTAERYTVDVRKLRIMAEGEQNKRGKDKNKREPGKRCAVMFCSNTNADNVSLHQFPDRKDEPRRSKWIAFVLAKRNDHWIPGTGHICSNHFASDCYNALDAKLAGFSTKLVSKSSAVPTIQITPTPEQLDAARSLKRKHPDQRPKHDKGSKAYSIGTFMTPKRSSRAVSKLTAHRVSPTPEMSSNKFFLILLLSLSQLLTMEFIFETACNGPQLQHLMEMGL